MALAAATLLVGCGTLPPEAFWAPTAEDSTAISAVVESNRNFLTTGLAETSLDYISTTLPGTTATLLREEMISNPFKQRFRVDSMQHVFNPYQFEYRFVGSLDTAKAETTATVTVVETIPGTLRFHAYQMTRYLRDTAITTVVGYANGYAVGLAGRLMVTADGGQTWTQQTVPTTANLNSVRFPLDFRTGYAVGDGGAVIRTTSGASWASLTSGTSEDLNGLSFPQNIMVGYAVGDAGTVIKTTDGGATWAAQASGTTENLNSVVFLADRRQGLVVGNAGTIARTTNGTAWSAVTSGTAENLNGVTLLADNRTACAVGANGTVLRSADVGATWATVSSGVSTTLRAVTFPSAAVGYIVGDAGTVLKTTNGGQAWTALASGTSVNLHAVSFAEGPSAGLAVGENGAFIRTVDGGATWTAGAAGTTTLAGLAFGATRDTAVTLPLHDTVFTDTSIYIEKPIEATSINGMILNKAGGVWSKWRLLGGSRMYAPTPEDAPYIVYLTMTGPAGTESVFLRPDTLHYGMQRFYDPESVPTFSRGESVRVSFLANSTNNGDAADYGYLVRDTMIGDSIVRLFHQRYEFVGAASRIRFDTLMAPGLYRLYLEHIPIAVFWDPDVDYTATVWGIPLLIK
jgi:photosystem II stability/assembly factor-like uncharacterized protein